jgi:1-deoxy-D-xylulose-5-phosphate reductoisomerase
VLTFEAVDTALFGAFKLGVDAGRAGGTAPAVFNAANEIAVAGCLAGDIPFGGIAGVIERTLSKHETGPVDSIERVLEADRFARAEATRIMRS